MVAVLVVWMGEDGRGGVEWWWWRVGRGRGRGAAGTGLSESGESGGLVVGWGGEQP